MPDHVKLTGTHHQIKQDVERYNDINLLYTLHTSWKYFEINCSTFIYLRKAHFKNNVDVTIPHAFVLRKTLCTTSSVSERCDMYSENHSVVIRSIRLHSVHVKSTLSRLRKLMGI